jgi:hypothetical protein
MEQVADNHTSSIAGIYISRVKPDAAVPPPTNYKEFYDFPGLCGWEIQEDFTLKATGERQQRTLGFFLQSWLFFGLIFTVLQTDGRPIMTSEDLVQGEPGEEQLSTKKLHKKIDRWVQWQLRTTDGLHYRMIQLDWILDYARRVLQATCAYNKGDTRREVWYDDEDHTRNGSLSISDKSVLVLMCLGETLSSAKARIMEANDGDAQRQGWHGDDYAGWGPPRFVIAEMKRKNWCPRSVELLLGQTNSNATMLLAAYYAYKDHPDSTRTEGHKAADCTSQECKVSPKDKDGNYRGRHTLECRTSDGDPADCEDQMKGPDMSRIVAMLEAEDNIVPLLRFRDQEDGTIGFDVLEFDPTSRPTTQFVTISHVWSDGWGNERANELHPCQLKFIRQQIQRDTGDEHFPFWMDSLVVPIGSDTRRKAIRQIFDVFDASKSTIILDNGLSEIARGGATRPAEDAMRILGSVWMQRVWTLQEAYLSQRIVIPFLNEDNEANHQRDFDQLMNKMSDASSSGVTRMIKNQLFHMIMGNEREKRKDHKKRNDISNLTQAVVANAWRAARWRVRQACHGSFLAWELG